MGSDTAVRAGCSMLNISRFSLACFLPRAALASRSRAPREPGAEGGAAAQASAVASPWTAAAPARLQRRRNRLLKQLRAELFL